jgi:hypothetical protein
MAYTDLEGREGLSAHLAEAIDRAGEALAALGVAYEKLDDQTADVLEERLFGPVQRGFGRAKKTYADFGARHGLQGQEFEEPMVPSPAHSPSELIESVAVSVEAADLALIELQDERALLEVGDQELRAGVASTREALADVPRAAREMLRTLGR